MGRGDGRMSLKIKQRRAQRKKKLREKRRREQTKAARADKSGK